MGILYKQSNVTTVYVNNGGDLPNAVICGVSPDTTGYNDALKLDWRRANGTSIPLLTSSTNTISQNSNGQRELYVKNVSVDDEGWYVCQYTKPDVNQTNNASLSILVNGLCTCLSVHQWFCDKSFPFAVDCGWSEWSYCSPTCGVTVGSRKRLANNPERRHRGRKCSGSPVESCLDLPPCIRQTVQFVIRLGYLYILIGPPSIINFTTTKQVDEGGSLELRCEALIPQLANVDQIISFQWAKNGKDGKEMLVSGNDRRVTAENYRDPNWSHFFHGIFQLKTLSRFDSGSYTCRINGSIGTSSFSTNSVRVNVKCNVIIYTAIPTTDHSSHSFHFYFSCA